MPEVFSLFGAMELKVSREASHEMVKENRQPALQHFALYGSCFWSARRLLASRVPTLSSYANCWLLMSVILLQKWNKVLSLL